MKPFFLHEQKVKTNLNILRTKRAFKMQEKAFSIIFKGLSLKQVKELFLKGESPNLRELENVEHLQSNFESSSTYYSKCV